MRHLVLSSFALASLAGCTLVRVPFASGAAGAASSGGGDSSAARRAAADPPQTVVGYIDPPDIHLKYDGELHGLRVHYALLMRGADRGPRPNVYLIGHGAPADPLGVDSRDEKEGFDGTHLEPGPYRLEVRIGTKVVGTREFHIIQVADAGKRTRLDIDPREQAPRIYFHRGTVRVTVAVDARADRRLTVAWVKNGSVKKVLSEYMRAPSLATADGLGNLYTVDTWEDHNDISYGTPGHHELAAVLGGEVIGSWSFDIKGEEGVATHASGWSGFDLILPGFGGKMSSDELSAIPHADPNAKEAIRAALAGNAEGRASWDATHTNFTEQVVCAVAEDPKVAEALRQIYSGMRELRHAGWQEHDAVMTMEDDHATTAQHANAGRTIAAVQQNTGSADGILAGLRAKVQRGGSRFQRGCLAKLLPPGVLLAK